MSPKSMPPIVVVVVRRPPRVAAWAPVAAPLKKARKKSLKPAASSPEAVRNS